MFFTQYEQFLIRKRLKEEFLPITINSQILKDLLDLKDYLIMIGFYYCCPRAKTI